MAIYRIYPQKSATIWSEPNISNIYGNAGRDEILEIGGYPDVNLTGRTNRSLIKFTTNDITSTISNKVSGLYSASLKLYLAEAGNLPTSFIVEGFPISSSWEQGNGKRDDSPLNTTGVSWKYRDAQTTEWDSLGSDYITNYTASQNFDVSSNLDLDLDVTSMVSEWNSGGVNNEGILLKINDSLENNTTSSINLKYFSENTNTIFQPYLEFKWDDSIYSSTLTELSTDIATISIKNHKEEYIDSDKSRFRISAKPKYPARTFTTSSVYLTNYKLPENSYWGIRDEFSEEMIIDFDTQYTKLSADNQSSYFDLYMHNLQPERFYRLLIKTNLNGSDLVIDNSNIFKVVRNG